MVKNYSCLTLTICYWQLFISTAKPRKREIRRTINIRRPGDGKIYTLNVIWCTNNRCHILHWYHPKQEYYLIYVNIICSISESVLFECFKNFTSELTVSTSLFIGGNKEESEGKPTGLFGKGPKQTSGGHLTCLSLIYKCLNFCFLSLMLKITY